MIKLNMPCPCGKNAGKRLLTYADCCGRYLDDFDPTPAPDAESLMRSRYSAFTLERTDYLQATWDSAQRPATLDFDPGRKWLGLRICKVTLIDTQHAEVEFVARSRLAGRGSRLHERSRFVRRDGRWFYVDGDILD
ncbi:MAG: YchJ family metal-binding protein [Burkholderiaceae bacterium]